VNAELFLEELRAFFSKMPITSQISQCHRLRNIVGFFSGNKRFIEWYLLFHLLSPFEEISKK